jgi:hypothetical protein
MLATVLRAQRFRGRSSAGDLVRGAVIEDGEAEGLLSDLASTWGPAREEVRAPRASSPSIRLAIAERADLGVAQGAFLPLRHAVRAFDLSSTEYDALVVALAVETDARFGRLVAYLNDHVARTRPTVGLALTLAAAEDGMEIDPRAAVEFASRPLVRDGLLEIEGEGPAPGATLRVAPVLLPHLALCSPSDQDSVADRVLEPCAGLLTRLALAEAVRLRAERWAESVRENRAYSTSLLIAGDRGTGSTSLAHAAVSLSGRRLAFAPLHEASIVEGLRDARRAARWHDAVVCLEWPDTTSGGLDWREVWREMQALGSRLVMTIPPRVVEEAAAAAPREPAIIELTVPEAPQRARMWRAMIPDGSVLENGDVEYLAGRFRFGPGRITRAIRMARASAATRVPAERRLSAADLESACRSVGASAMGTLAQRMPLPYRRSDLVVPPDVDAELDLALAWVRHRHTVVETWGFGRRIMQARGLAVLLAGKPGVGKTMCAQVLARELGCELYRCDLSRVYDKYIGESEKALSQLFREAESSGVVLLFDEADALFGKRTEIKDSHDRLANVTIGHLLQLMDGYEGVSLLASNRMRDLDEAFVRRLQIIIQFPMPEVAERIRLWQRMLPAGEGREPDLDTTPLARQFEISGGDIRNVVLAAAYLAAHAGEPIGMRHINRALLREFKKNGRVLSREEMAVLVITATTDSTSHAQ